MDSAHSWPAIVDRNSNEASTWDSMLHCCAVCTTGISMWAIGTPRRQPSARELPWTYATDEFLDKFWQLFVRDRVYWRVPPTIWLDSSMEQMLRKWHWKWPWHWCDWSLSLASVSTDPIGRCNASSGSLQTNQKLPVTTFHPTGDQLTYVCIWHQTWYLIR